MKAISLWQPWASLVALGVKTIETRSWATSFRGPLAIHAAKKRPRRFWTRYGEVVTADVDPVWSAVIDRYDLDGLTESGEGDDGYFWHEWRGPLGAVVATCELVDVVPIVDDPAARNCVDIRMCGARPPRPALRVDSPTGEDIADLGDEYPYGDFRPGRFAWLLADVKPIEPVPARGRQGLWEWVGQPSEGQQ